MNEESYFRDPSDPHRNLSVGYTGIAAVNLRRALLALYAVVEELHSPGEYRRKHVVWPQTLGGISHLYDAELAAAVMRLQLHFRGTLPDEDVIVDGQVGSNTPRRIVRALLDHGLDIWADMDVPGRYDAFLSYSRSGRGSVAAAQLYDGLSAGGRRVFRDTSSIPAGAHWLHTVTNALRDSSALVLVLCGDSVRSDVVVAELAWARCHEKRCIPVVVDDVRLPSVFEQLLASAQNVTFDARQPGTTIAAVEFALRS